MEFELEYSKIECSTIDLPKVLDHCLHNNFSGFNVTTPHKEEIAKLCNSSLPSCNTVSIDKGEFQAFSTDSLGLERALNRVGVNFSHFNNISILGSGGVVAALLIHFRKLNLSANISILRRNKDRDLFLNKMFASARKSIHFLPFDRDVFSNLVKRESHLLISAIPDPRILSDFALDLHDLNGYFIDLSYGIYSPLLEKSKKTGYCAPKWAIYAN